MEFSSPWPFAVTYFSQVTSKCKGGNFGKEHRRKKPWVTRDVVDLCDERRDLKTGMKQRGQKIQRIKQENSEDSEERKGGLDRCSVRREFA